MTVKRLPRFVPKRADDALARKIKQDVESMIQTHEDFMFYLGRLDPKALLDDIDSTGGESD